MALVSTTALICILMTGCRPTSTVMITDSAGRQVSMPKSIERIVSLAPSATESLFALGAAKMIVGTDDFSNYPPPAVNITKVGALSPDIEKIVALEPDLVVGAFITAPEIIEKIEATGITVWIADSKEVLGVAQAIELLGQAIGYKKEGADVASKLIAEIQTVVRVVSSVEHRPRVFHELDATDPTKPYTIGPGNFVHDLINLAGGNNVFADAPMPFAQVSLEQVLARNPEVIILADAPFGVSAESVKRRTGWGRIDAITNNRLFVVTQELSDQMSIPGPRIAQGLRAVAEFLHPELFR